MPRHLLYLIVFIEGFCSLGAEVIALRRLVPHVGSSIVVTAPTIGFFLLALALGYASGAKVSERFTAVVARNFLISALLAGIGLARLNLASGWHHLVAGTMRRASLTSRRSLSITIRVHPMRSNAMR